MIQIKPVPGQTFRCPECAALVAVDRISIPGMNMYAECHCSHCRLGFIQMLPAGHYVNTSVSMTKDSRRIYNTNKEGYDWLTRIVQQSFPLQDTDVIIRKKVLRKCERVVILNTLDFLYGHVLLKLFNAQYHLDHDTEKGLILVIPSQFEWMIPEGCSEVWVVDLPLSQLVRGYESIRRFTEGELNRFTEVAVSEAYSHPEPWRLDITRFTDVPPFDLRQFEQSRPTFTFVLREDRWWLARPVYQALYRIARKADLLKPAGKILARQQNRLVKSAIKRIKRQIPTADFFVVGLGKTGDFRGSAHDRRVPNPPGPTVEREWCTIYAKTHVVIGVHGSNLLLPTALAAACIEVLPADRHGNIVQDICVRMTDRRQLFLYRFIEQYSRPGTIAMHATSIVRHYGSFFRNMCVNTFDANDGSAAGLSPDPLRR